MRLTQYLLLVVASVSSGFNVGAQDSSCVTVRDRATQHAIQAALLRVAGDTVSTRDSWTDAAGRACVTRSSGRVHVGALGYEDVVRDLRVGERPEIVLERLTGSHGPATGDTVEWRQG